jgi:hypothetical protein
MNVALQKRRLWIALGVTGGAVLVALVAVTASFAYHAPWGLWLFAAAILVGFGSHAWLIVGVARDRTRP